MWLRFYPCHPVFIARQQALQWVRLCDELTSRLVALMMQRYHKVESHFAPLHYSYLNRNFPILFTSKSTCYKCLVNTRSTRHRKQLWRVDCLPFGIWCMHSNGEHIMYTTYWQHCCSFPPHNVVTSMKHYNLNDAIHAAILLHLVEFSSWHTHLAVC